MNKYGVRECKNIKSFFFCQKIPAFKGNAEDESMVEETELKRNQTTRKKSTFFICFLTAAQQHFQECRRQQLWIKQVL